MLGIEKDGKTPKLSIKCPVGDLLEGLAQVEERMRLAVRLNRQPREAPALGDVEAVKAHGQSYQDLNEGNGFLVAGELYGDVKRFLGLCKPRSMASSMTTSSTQLAITLTPTAWPSGHCSRRRTSLSTTASLAVGSLRSVPPVESLMCALIFVIVFTLPTEAQDC